MRRIWAALERRWAKHRAAENAAVAVVESSILFNAKWYTATYPAAGIGKLAPARHFVRHGVQAYYNPGPYFDTRFYLTTYPDVAAAGINPLVHYVRHGEAEMRERSAGGAASDDAVSAADTAPLPGLFPGSTFDELSTAGSTAPYCHLAAATLVEGPARADAMAASPRISLLLPVGEGSPATLGEMLQSVLMQTYTWWELCLTYDCAISPDTLAFIIGSPLLADSRMIVQRVDENRTSSSALAMASGDYVVFVNGHDRLTPRALSEIIACLRRNPANSAVYTDSVLLDDDGCPHRIVHKPAWSPETLLSTNYIGSFLVVRRSIMTSVEDLDELERDAAITLALVREGANVQHVATPVHLYRDDIPSPDQEERLLRLRERHLYLCDSRATPVWPAAFRSPRVPAFRIDFDHLSHRTALIVLASGMAEDADIGDRFSALVGPAVTVHVVSLAAGTGAVGRVLDSDAAMLAFLAELDDEVVAFARTTTRYIGIDWLARLSGYAAIDPHVGAAGGKILDPWLQVRAGGMLVDAAGVYRTIGGGLSDSVPLQANSGLIASNVDAVSSQLMATRRDTLVAMGGLRFHAFGDAAGAAYCATLVMQGQRIVYDPQARAIDAGLLGIPDDAWPRLRDLGRRAASKRRYPTLGA